MCVPLGPALIYPQHLQTLVSFGILLETLLLPETVGSTIFPTVNTPGILLLCSETVIFLTVIALYILKSEAFSHLVTLSCKWLNSPQLKHWAILFLRPLAIAYIIISYNISMLLVRASISFVPCPLIHWRSQGSNGLLTFSHCVLAFSNVNISNNLCGLRV